MAHIYQGSTTDMELHHSPNADNVGDCGATTYMRWKLSQYCDA